MLLYSVFFIVAMAGQAQSPTEQKPVLVVTPRVNSTGHFPFSGAYINHHFNFDFNIFFEHKSTGFFIFKSVDLEDHHSIVNYLQQGVFRKFKISSRFQVRAFAGYVFSQTTEFRDRDSDYFTSVAGYWTINEQLKIENTVLYFDLSQSPKISNRLLLTYQVKNFHVDVYLWQRIVFETHQYATSASLAVTIPKIKLTNAMYIQNTISYQTYLTEAKPDWAMRQGLLVSVAIPIAL
jgi:hypothetical protein